MSNRDHLIVGLDIGTTKICAVAAEPDSSDPLNIVGFGTATSAGRCSPVSRS